MPNTAIEGDPSFHVIDTDTLQVRKGERWQRYKKCTTETKPTLNYSTMQEQRPKAHNPAGGVRFKPYYGA